MARYIDAEKIRITAQTVNEDGDALVSLADVRRAIEQTPTADVVEVVRCKDCKENPNYIRAKGMCWCRKFKSNVHKTGFCSYGERKEQEDGC